ncbi:MAG: F0F1 ATP synthase subunit A [Sphingobacterium sp.]|nr:F0F1 ATP synthase subunit A [Sphingobacterium sp.]
MAPTSSINVTLGCALTVWVYYHYPGRQGAGRSAPTSSTSRAPPGAPLFIAPIMLPIEIISHLSRVLSLSLRLFGNVFGEELVILILFSIVPFIAPLPMMFLGIITMPLQAFIFVMLTMIYLGGAVAAEHGHEEAHGHGEAAARAMARRPRLGERRILLEEAEVVKTRFATDVHVRGAGPGARQPRLRAGDGRAGRQRGAGALVDHHRRLRPGDRGGVRRALAGQGPQRGGRGHRAQPRGGQRHPRQPDPGPRPHRVARDLRAADLADPVLRQAVRRLARRSNLAGRGPGRASPVPALVRSGRRRQPGCGRGGGACAAG